MDTTHAIGGSSTRNHVHAEWAELRPSLDQVALQAKSLIASLRDIPRPLFADERRKSEAARVAFAEQVKDSLVDLLDDLVGPLHRRTDDAGIDVATVAVDLDDL